MNKPVDTDTPQSTAEPPALKRGQSAQVQRDLRSKAALKANMARRKAQVSGKAQARGKDAGAATDGSTADQPTKNEQAKHE